MTIGQYLLSFAVIGVVVIGLLLSAQRRGQAMFAATTAAVMLAAAAFFSFRSSSHKGPSSVRSTAVAVVAIAVAAGVIYLRRNASRVRGRVITAALAWVGLVFAWFETAYLLRP